jgi:transposase
MMQNDFQSLQKENADLREENTLLRALVAELLPLKTHVEELSAQVKTLEARLSKDSHNSHLPPSSDRFARQKKTKSLRKASGKKAGAQPDHEGNTLYQSKVPDQIVIHRVETCVHCLHDLSEHPALSMERRQVLDLPPKRIVVIEPQVQEKWCPDCQHLTKAAFPEGVSAPVQYGPALGAVGVYLVQQQLLPFARACETIQDLLGPAMSVGTLQALIERCSKQLQPLEEEIKDALRSSEVMHHDETGMYLMGQRWWMHVSATSTLTQYAVHRKRGSQAMNAIGILPAFTGVLVHDGLSTYWGYHCDHALWNVHHLRELLFLDEVEKQTWAGELKTLLLEMKTAVEQAQSEGRCRLNALEVADWKARYQDLLQEGYQANPPPAADVPRKRGRRKQSAARNLLDRLSTHQDAVLLFLERWSVPFDNSQAERDIRMVKVQQKVSGGFRSAAGAEAFCRIRGYLSTLRKQGTHLLTALELALAGHPISPAF